jgi:hypothetical protein
MNVFQFVTDRIYKIFTVYIVLLSLVLGYTAFMVFQTSLHIQSSLRNDQIQFEQVKTNNDKIGENTVEIKKLEQRVEQLQTSLERK